VLRRLTTLSLLLLSLSFGEAQTRYALPGATVEEEGDALGLSYEGRTLLYAPGLGWLERGLRSAPVVEGGEVYVGEDVLSYLGVTLPRLTGVRSSGGGTVRVVFDFENLSREALPLRKTGRVGAGEALTLTLPPLLRPQDLPARVEGLELDLEPTLRATLLRLRGPAFRYEAFALKGPTRLVVDVTADLPAGDTLLDAREGLLSGLFPPLGGPRTLAPGVTLRRLSHPTVAGESRVDLVEIAPNRGAFRIVGGSYGPRPLSELAAGGLVGINASYFDTEGGRTIGLLKRNADLLSLPSRGRAAIGFGFGTPVIGRVKLELKIRVNGQEHRFPPSPDGRVALHTTVGETVGTPRQGAIVVRGGRVLENKVGPRRVPPGGFVLTYVPDLHAPELRALALVDPGDTLRYDAELLPRAFNFVPYAVEAGPLLVEEGRPAYAPGLEVFDTRDPESNVNRRTTRAAVGVRADGTVLFVTATQMTARELVPLLLELGAEDALQMDSGGSSTLFAGGAVVNRPPLLQRRVATAIVYSPRW